MLSGARCQMSGVTRHPTSIIRQVTFIENVFTKGLIAH